MLIAEDSEFGNLRELMGETGNYGFFTVKLEWTIISFFNNCESKIIMSPIVTYMEWISEKPITPLSVNSRKDVVLWMWNKIWILGNNL